MRVFLGLLPALAMGSVMPALGQPALSQPALSQQGPILLSPAPPSAPGMVQANADTGYLRTTTDSPEYCKQLYGQVDHLMRGTKTTTNDKARTLTEEGERLCQRGQTRSGIQYLRQAYVLLSKAEPTR